MKYFLYLLGFLPSIIWLLFYLRKDAHPEPNRKILKIFIYGIVVAYITIFLQIILQKSTERLNVAAVWFWVIEMFIGAGLIEESMKYSAVRFGMFGDKELDEPPDLVLYMIISALGFAALENILYLNQQVLNERTFSILSSHSALLPAKATLQFLSWRFISATFLHALSSGVLGYFLALSFYYVKQKKLYTLLGIGLAAGFHGIYNWALVALDDPYRKIIPIILLILLGSFVSYSLRKLKRLQSTCLLDA